MGRWWIGVLFVAACGSDDGGTTHDDSGMGSGGGEPLSSSAAMGLCMDYCVHQTVCGSLTSEQACTAACVRSVGYRNAEWASAFYECLTNSACGEPNLGMTCLDMAEAAAPPRQVHQDYMAMCLAIPSRCPGFDLPGGSDGDCRINQVQGYSDMYMHDVVLPCLGLACNMIQNCFETIDGF